VFEKLTKGEVIMDQDTPELKDGVINEYFYRAPWGKIYIASIEQRKKCGLVREQIFCTRTLHWKKKGGDTTRGNFGKTRSPRKKKWVQNMEGGKRRKPNLRRGGKDGGGKGNSRDGAVYGGPARKKKKIKRENT